MNRDGDECVDGEVVRGARGMPDAWRSFDSMIYRYMLIVESFRRDGDLFFFYRGLFLRGSCDGDHNCVCTTGLDT